MVGAVVRVRVCARAVRQVINEFCCAVLAPARLPFIFSNVVSALPPPPPLAGQKRVPVAKGAVVRLPSARSGLVAGMGWTTMAFNRQSFRVSG